MSPVVSVVERREGDATLVTLTAEDTGSGVTLLRDSLDGATYRDYTGVLRLNPHRTPVLYAYADDAVANRATLVHELSPTPIPIPNLTWWGLAVMALLVAGLGYVRLRNVGARPG